MTAVAEVTRSDSLSARLADSLAKLRVQDTVPYLTLFLAVAFGFTWWPFYLVSQVALLSVLLFPSTARSPVLWGVLAATATVTVVHEWDLADNHKYLLCYWIWVMCIAHTTDDSAFRDRIIRFNARFFLIFIFLGAAVQKFFSHTYMSGAMFGMELLLDPRFQAFAHLVGIDHTLGDESVRRMALLQNPYVQVVDNYIKLVANDHVRYVATLVTFYDFYVQVAIGALLLFRRAITDVIANLLLLFFILTTYLPAPVLGFGFTLAILGFALVKERSQSLSVAYLISMAAVLFYQVPWRDWVLGT